jgi:hypothetical protein
MGYIRRRGWMLGVGVAIVAVVCACVLYRESGFASFAGQKPLDAQNDDAIQSSAVTTTSPFRRHILNGNIPCALYGTATGTGTGYWYPNIIYTYLPSRESDVATRSPIIPTISKQSQSPKTRVHVLSYSYATFRNRQEAVVMEHIIFRHTAQCHVGIFYIATRPRAVHSK